MLPFFVALMLWNAVTAHGALARWFAAGFALIFAGCAGWFVRKLWESKQLAVLVVVSASLLGCGGNGSPTGPTGASGVRLILSVPSFAPGRCAA